METKKIDLTKNYPLLPLRDVVIFPHMIIPLFVGRDLSVKALNSSMKDDRLIVLASQVDSQVIEPEEKNIYKVGTIAEILQLLKLPDGTIKVLVEGKIRVALSDFNSQEGFFRVKTDLMNEGFIEENKVDILKKAFFKTFEHYVNTNKKVPKEVVESLNNIKGLSQLIDVAASHIDIKVEHKQTILNVSDTEQRLIKLIEILNAEIEIIALEKKIHSQVRNQMEKAQKDYYLNEKVKVIKKELGQGDDDYDEITSLKDSIEKARITSEAKDKAFQEIKRLEKMPPISAEAAIVRTYIEWLRDLPWHRKTKDINDINKAKQILDDDHYGLEDVKERIIEYIAVRQLSKKNQGPILCFVGPPGVGKTSLGKSVARSIGRNFIRMSLGGVRDEAEIRGHRRTYVGALPGRIIQMMKKTNSVNPVILLDEIDKMSMDFRGDPSSALLEVLDPEQNSNFVDHYMEIPYDLSKVMFITTANVQHDIPLPLLDRMEIIEISSYTEPEKLNIALKFLLNKQIELNGLKVSNIKYSKEMMLYTIRHYTKEAGVRDLERVVAKVCRKVARELVGKKSKDFSKTITESILHKYLGPIKYNYGQREEKSEIGLANGLAWTAVGGDILKIEALLTKGEGKLTLTGKLGEVMKESAQAAFTYIKANQQFYNLDEDILKNNDIHLHVPEGAIPKDGPSAGITMAVVLASLLSGIPVRADVAMTGEITLRGKVLPIGGLKEKALAAHRANINHIIIPKENKKDLDKIAEDVKSRMVYHPVNRMEEVLYLALKNPSSFFRDKKIHSDLGKFLDNWSKDLPSDNPSLKM